MNSPKNNNISEDQKKTGILQGLKDSLYNSRLYNLTLASRAPGSVRGIPANPWPHDLDQARLIIKGGLFFHGRQIKFSANVWDKEWSNQAARAELNSFAWLNGLKQLANEQARISARKMLISWLDKNQQWDTVSWRPDVLGQRLASWFINLSFICPDEEDALRKRLLKSATRQEKHLSRTIGELPKTARRFTALKGMIYCGACLSGQKNRLEAGLKMLSVELNAQIHPDGGHYQRSPSIQLALLKDLIDIRELLILAQVEVPISLQGAIDRMAPMLRGYRHGDGRLALFNDGKEEDSALIDMALTKSEVQAKPSPSAPHTGYQRMVAGRALVIADTGNPPPTGADTRAHTGLLSFEFSIGKNRLVVNCGAYREEEAQWQIATRATAAHSTLTVNDTNALEVLAGGGLASKEIEVRSLRREADGNIWLETGHNGYQKLFGLHHARNLYLSASGDDLRGEDILEGSGGDSYSLRFHLHPQVKASIIQDGSGVLIQMPDGAGWRFLTNVTQLSLEDSIYFGSTKQPRKTEQIVVSGPLDGKGAQIKWAFSKIGE